MADTTRVAERARTSRRHVAPGEGRVCRRPAGDDVVDRIIWLQRTAGNAAVGEVLRRYHAQQTRIQAARPREDAGGPVLGRKPVAGGVAPHESGVVSPENPEPAHLVGQGACGGAGPPARGPAGASREHAAHAAGSVPAPLQRKEAPKDGDIRGKQDWTTADRENNTTRWQEACLINLNAVDSGQYVRIVERRDFYKWFYEYTAARGYTTRWALAAYVVANGAHQIADMNEDHDIANDVIGLAGAELQGAMREGNQDIFDNVLPKLKKLLDGGPLKGPAALKWDSQVLAEEQTLIQPLYDMMSPETLEQLDYIARKGWWVRKGASWTGDDKVPKGPYNNPGTVPAFDQPNLKDPHDRWMYGMEIGNQFAPGGTGFDPTKDIMPAVGAGYQHTSEFQKVDTRGNLHRLDAYLSHHGGIRGRGADIRAIIASVHLHPIEQQQILADQSPDGWAYSTRFAQWRVEEDLVRDALPSDPALADKVAAFLARYKAALAEEEDRYRHVGPSFQVPAGI